MMNSIRTLEPQFVGHVRDNVNLTHRRIFLLPALPLYRYATIKKDSTASDYLQPSAFLEIVEGLREGQVILRGRTSSSLQDSRPVQLLFEAMNERGQYAEVARCDICPINHHNFDVFTAGGIVVEPYLLMSFAHILAAEVSERCHELGLVDQDGTQPHIEEEGS